MLPLASAISNRLDKSSSQRTCEIVNFSLISVDFCYWLFGRSRGGGLSDGERIFDRKRPCHRSRSLLFQRTDEIHLGASRSLRKTPADSPEARGGVVTPTLITPPALRCFGWSNRRRHPIGRKRCPWTTPKRPPGGVVTHQGGGGKPLNGNEPSLAN